MKIRKILCLLAMCLLISFTGQSKNIVDYFLDMPLTLMPTLESSYRVELVENYQQLQRDTLQNRFDTTVKLLKLDTLNQNIAVCSTSSSRFEMQVFEHQNDTLIGIINTVCAPICSSYIKFYDTDWNEVKVDFPKFSYKSWLKYSLSDEEKETVEKIVKVSFIEYAFNSNENVVNVKNNSLDFLGEEDILKVADFLTSAPLKVPFEKVQKMNTFHKKRTNSVSLSPN